MTPEATGIGLFLHAQMPDDSQQDIGSTTQEGDTGLTLLRHACSPAPSAELSLIPPPLRPGFSPHARVRDAEWPGIGRGSVQNGMPGRRQAVTLKLRSLRVGNCG